MHKIVTVAVLGASSNPERYSNKALLLLLQKGHTVFPVNPACVEIHRVPCYKKLRDIPDEIDTVTLYVSSAVSDSLADQILEINPRRVIFNPGAENPRLLALLREKGITGIEACTLVLLNTGRFV